MSELKRLNADWIRALENVKTIVSHKGCADGVMSVLILNWLIADADVVLCQYNMKEHRELRCEKGMLFCDMSPPDERAEEFAEVGAIVLDHHRSQKSIFDKVDDVNWIYDPNLCGAEMAYQYVWRVLDPMNAWPKDIAELTGIYDCWRKDSHRWEEACALREALLLYPLDHLVGLGLDNVVSSMDELILPGRALLDRNRSKARSIASGCYSTGWVLLCESLGLQNYIADHLREMEDDHMFLAAWSYKPDKDGLRLVVSLRALQDNVDVSKIAKILGGGGHRAAASFSIPFDICDNNPVSEIMDLIVPTMFKGLHLDDKE